MEKLAFCTMESTLLNIPERARGLKNNYRPLNVLSVLPKLFERLLSKQFAEFFETISLMSMWLCIRKGYGLQHCLQMKLET